jgi:hypothetical protein
METGGKRSGTHERESDNDFVVPDAFRLLLRGLYHPRRFFLVGQDCGGFVWRRFFVVEFFHRIGAFPNGGVTQRTGKNI